MLNRTQTHLNKDRKNLVNPRFALAQLSPTFKYFCLRPKIPPKLLRYFQVQLICSCKAHKIMQMFVGTTSDVDNWHSDLSFIIFIISVLGLGKGVVNSKF